MCVYAVTDWNRQQVETRVSPCQCVCVRASMRAYVCAFVCVCVCVSVSVQCVVCRLLP